MKAALHCRSASARPTEIPRRSCHPSSGATARPIHAQWKAMPPSISSTRPTKSRRSPPTRRRRRASFPGLAGPTADDPLKLYVRQIGDGRLLTPAQERELARLQGPGRRGGEAQAHRVEPPARHVDHAQLHARRGPAPRPHPGGESRPHPRRREVRLPDGLQALHVRDVVDQAGDLARARGAGEDDPASRPRRRPGSEGDEDPSPPRPEAQPRPLARGDRRRDRHHARARAGAARARASTR